MIPIDFGRAFQRYTSRLDRHFLLTFQTVMLISKTCNQLQQTLAWISEGAPVGPRDHLPAASPMVVSSRRL